MRALAAFIMRGRMQAILTVVLCTVASLMLPPLNFLGLAAVALVTLRVGAAPGLTVVGGAAVGTAAAGYLLLGANPLQTLLPLIGMWLLIWGLAMVLRLTVSLPRTLAAAGLLTLPVIGLFYLVVGDVEGYWRNVVEVFFAPLMDGNAPRMEVNLIRETMLGLAPQLTGVLAAGTLLSLLACLLLGRWWQASLYNPGGFREEFHRLRLDRWSGAGLLALLAAASLGSGGLSHLALDLALPLVVVFMFAGIALVHALNAGGRGGMFWLVGFYFFLVLVQPMALVVALVAVADSWVGFRERIGRRGQS